MALTCRALFRNCNFVSKITKNDCWNVRSNYSLRVVSSGISYSNNFITRPITEIQQVRFISVRKCSTVNPESSGKTIPEKPQPQDQKLSLVQRFKQMYKDYWYVLLPVHLCTSAVWFGSYYYAVRSGVDVLGILESYGVSEKVLEPVRNSGAGHLAITFALYKLSSPLRYAVTLGGTTFAIKRLQAIGWIKPVPSRERLKEMFQERKDTIQDRFNESKQHYQTQIQKAKCSQFMEEMRKYKAEMKNMKNKVKKI